MAAFFSPFQSPIVSGIIWRKFDIKPVIASFDDAGSDHLGANTGPMPHTCVGSNLQDNAQSVGKGIASPVRIISLCI